jgi:hypothetical protein
LCAEKALPPSTASAFDFAARQAAVLDFANARENVAEWRAIAEAIEACRPQPSRS